MSLLMQREDGTGGQALATPPPLTDTEIAIPARRSELHDYEIDGEAVIFDTRTHGMYLLNQTALAVFRNCDGRTTMRQVAESLSETYDVAPEDALAHVEHIVAMFSHSRLLDLGRES